MKNKKIKEVNKKRGCCYGIFKPTLLKVIIVILIFVLLYLCLMSSIRVRYTCTVGGEQCVKETAAITQKIVLQDMIIIGIPLAIIAWIVIGVIEVKLKRK
jgi:hypothetical protein